MRMQRNIQALLRCQSRRQAKNQPQSTEGIFEVSYIYLVALHAGCCRVANPPFRNLFDYPYVQERSSVQSTRHSRWLGGWLAATYLSRSFSLLTSKKSLDGFLLKSDRHRNLAMNG